MATLRTLAVKEQLRTIRKAAFKWFAQKFLKIRTKRGQVAPFVLNKAQLYAHERVERQRREIGKVRAVIIKGRQQGFSTWIGARYYKITTETVGYSTFILSHESKTTGKLYEMVQRYHDHCPDFVKPTKDGDNKKLGMKFSSLESSYELGTAKNPDSGRGFTAQLFHGSEVAFWPFADQILAGVMQAVPDLPGTEVILESTANGVGGTFYEYVMDAYKKDGEFILIFSPWYWDSGYTDKVPAGFVRTADEIALAAMIANHPDGAEFKHDITDGQLAWRRKKIKELKSSDLFKQEYPSYVHEAFLASGRPVFDIPKLVEAKNYCRLPIKLMRYSRDADSLDVERNVESIEVDDPNDPKSYDFDSVSGLIQIWAEPIPGELYSAGADVSEGLEIGDFSSVDVLNEQGTQVATFHGKIEVSSFGFLLNKLGRYYNNAFLGVERNNHGHAVVQKLKDLDYPNLYKQEELEESHERETEKVGWLTTSKSKPIIIGYFGDLILDENTGILCMHTIDQSMTYVYASTGKMGAREGCFDDKVMSYAIALEMNKKMPRTKFAPVQQVKTQSWML
jgi:hypothetical protein